MDFDSQSCRIIESTMELFHSLGIVLSLIGHVFSIQLLEATIPAYAAADQPVQLSCPFRLSWGERVYSANWYWRGREFYRFYPAASPPSQVFQQPHFKVDLLASNVSTVLLHRLSRKASGTFRCEISTEAPYFNTISFHSVMTVADVPSKGPKIFGLKDRYKIGEYVTTICRLEKCLPAPSITWYLNGEEASQRQVRNITAENDLEYSSQLMFRLSPRQLREKKHLTIKCVASLNNFYWISDERQLVQYVDSVQSGATSTEAQGIVCSVLLLLSALIIK